MPPASLERPPSEVRLRPLHELDRVVLLVAQGLNDCQIARMTGVPRRTVRDWRVKYLHEGRLQERRSTDCFRCNDRGFDRRAYLYLLGLYLGDGSIARYPRTFRLRVVLDKRYPSIIDEAAGAMAAMRHPANHPVGRIDHVGCVEVCAYWQHWPCLFPQHGRGRKHERSIVLEAWQQSLVHELPFAILRGLVHSDGCRVTNRVWKGKYSYPRYFFSNESQDILQIFGRACEVAGVAYRYSRQNMISVARAGAVALLDEHIGPKA